MLVAQFSPTNKPIKSHLIDALILLQNTDNFHMGQ